MIKGELASLRPMESEDADLLYEWMLDRNTSRDMATGVIRSRDGWRDWIRDNHEIGYRFGCAYFSVLENSTGRMVGLAGMRDLLPSHRSAECELVIGDPSVRGEGLGAEAGLLLCRYAFGSLGVHRLTIETLNESIIWGAKIVGFQEEGVARQARFIEGEWVDVTLLAVLASEFRDVNPHRAT
jgi:RimJ/RimL family protein N-acetyltransferase